MDVSVFQSYLIAYYVIVDKVVDIVDKYVCK